MKHQWQEEAGRLLRSATSTAARCREDGYDEFDFQIMIAEATLAQALIQYDQTYPVTDDEETPGT